MALILKIFPYASPEIVTTAVTCFFMTLFGLSLGFALLKSGGSWTLKINLKAMVELV